jgi:hypothetical protein
MGKLNKLKRELLPGNFRRNLSLVKMQSINGVAMRQLPATFARRGRALVL